MADYTTIDNPELYFQCKIFTGNAGTLAVTLDGSENMSPNMVWIKPRETGSFGTKVWDTVRGATNYIETNGNGAEGTGLSGVDSFDSDGFTLGSYGGSNPDGTGTVAWCWKESATAGFDIVAYTGNDSNRNISHNLSSVPKFIIIKPRDQTDNWRVYHKGVDSSAEDYHLQLNENGARSDNATMFNDTAPTSSVFTVGTNSGINGDSNTFIAYVFSEKQGFSKFTNYKGNGNADGPFIWTGFRPALVVTKKSSDEGDWIIYDNKRDVDNLVHGRILLNDPAAEYTEDSHGLDFLSNGFKIRTSDQSWNESGETFVCMAFAEQPFVNSNKVPCNAR